MTKSKSTKKKEEVIVTEKILNDNPDLINEGVKPGDKVAIEESVDLSDLIAEKETEIEALKVELSELNSLKESKLELENSNKEKDELIKKLQEEKASGPQESAKKTIKVHHGVVIGSKTYSKKDIEEDEEIQEYLLANKSTAISTVD